MMSTSIPAAARAAAAASFALLAAACAAGTNGAADTTDAGIIGTPPADEYRVYVANESSDLVSQLVFEPGAGIRTVDSVTVGIMPGDIDGAHGLKVSPDGRHWYVSIAHGRPFGTVWKYTTGDNEFVAKAELGLFPATMSMTPAGDHLFAVNFNLHGEPVPSTVSVIYTPTMTEVAKPTTCVKPHGSRINVAGTKHYSVCVGSDQLVEIDTRSFEVTNRFSLRPGAERALSLDQTGASGGPAVASAATAFDSPCGPTWATPARGPRANRYVYVPCNKNAEVLEIDVRDWEVSRRFPTGTAPYNLDPTPDGRYLVASLKGEQTIAVFDLEQGEEIERLATTRPLPHGVVISEDGRYAFISNEAVGSTPGTVDVFDLERMQRVASVEVGFQPGGIDIWPTL